MSPERVWRYFDEEVSWAVYGDSHTTELAYSLASQLEDNKGLLHIGFSGCAPIITMTAEMVACSQWLRESLGYLVRDSAIENVLFDGAVRELIWKEFSLIVIRLLESGKKGYVLYPIPELPIDIAKAAFPFSIFSIDRTMLDLGRATTVSYYNDRHQFIIELTLWG